MPGFIILLRMINVSISKKLTSRGLTDGNVRMLKIKVVKRFENNTSVTDKHSQIFVRHDEMFDSLARRNVRVRYRG